jgi:hypothetical protein
MRHLNSGEFGWGWAGSPWYGYYSYYFQPSPVYRSAAFWLTDYVISQDLQAAYSAHLEAGESDGTPAASGGPPVLTPEVKQQIANEIKDQLALENQEAQQNAQGLNTDPGSSGIPRTLSDGRPHVFLAGENLDVTDTSGQECVLSDGDVLSLQNAPLANATSANLVVLASKGAPECKISLTVSVQLTDLQEMQNHMRESIDQGLQKLLTLQGKGGIPTAPPSAQSRPALAAYAAAAPPPDPSAAAEIQQQAQLADQAEKEVTAEMSQGSGGAASAAPSAPNKPASVEFGQTMNQVQSILGTPPRVAYLGPKVIYFYNGITVTFRDGRRATRRP